MLRNEEKDERKMVYIKIFVDDTLSKSELNLLTNEEYGVYIRLLLLFAKSPKKGAGYLENGEAITNQQYCELLHVKIEDWKRIISKLHGLIEPDKRGALWSPRFRKHQSEWFRIQAYPSQKDKGGKRRTFPAKHPQSSRKTTAKLPRVCRGSSASYPQTTAKQKQPAPPFKKGSSSTKTEKPMCRKSVGESQKTYNKHQHQHTASEAASASAINKATISVQIRDYWNSKKELKDREVLRLSETRKNHIETRLRELDFREGWKMIIDKIAESGFCNGKGKQKWKATFDWMIYNDANYIKVLEGKYDDPVKEIRTCARWYDDTCDQECKPKHPNGYPDVICPRQNKIPFPKMDGIDFDRIGKRVPKSGRTQ